MTDILIRPAVEGDIERLVEWGAAMAWETERKRLDIATVTHGVRAGIIDPGKARYFIAERDNQPAGTLMLTFEWSDWRNRMVWWIQSVYVSPDARQHGVFRALYAHVRDAARAEGAGGLRLYVDTTNVRAQQVYAALGMNGDHYRVFEDMF